MDNALVYTDVCVILPAYNEETTIAKVIDDVRHYLPGARVVVGDNNCSDQTPDIAIQAKADVVFESRQGKGAVVRKMLRVIDASVYVLIDADDTYDLTNITDLVNPVVEGSVDCVIGTRVEDTNSGLVFPLGHRVGNRGLTAVFNLLFSSQFNDLLSGYRVMSRDFAKNFSCDGDGFQLESELSVYTVIRKWSFREISVNYRARPPGSQSKIRTIRDGSLIFNFFITAFSEYRPLLFFGLLSFLSICLAMILIYPVALDYLATGRVDKLPTAILSGLLCVIGNLLFGIGIILRTLNRWRLEQLEMNLR